MRPEPWQAELCDGGASEGPVRQLSFYVDTALHARGKKAAMADGVKMAPWLRAMVRQITLTDFPARWQAARSEERSHDSRTYGKRFMLQLNKASQAKLQHLIRQFGTSKAHIIRQLLMQAKLEDFPSSSRREIIRRSRDYPWLKTRLSPGDTRPSPIASLRLPNCN